MVAQHVEDADRRQGRCEEVGPLVQRRADQETAVAAALDRDPSGARVALGDQPFGGGDEVVEDVLLVLLGAGEVPVAAVLPAAAQVRDRQHAAHLEPGEAGRGEAGGQGDVETAVAVEQRRVVAVLLDALAVGDEHRDARAVAALVEDLLRLVAVEVGVDRGAADQRTLAGTHVVAVDLRRRAETRVGVEGLRLLPAAAEAAGAADARQFDFAGLGRGVGAVRFGEADDRARVVQVVEDQLAADGGGVGERVLGFRDHLVQGRVPGRRTVVQVNGDDPVARRVLVRFEQEHGAEVHDVAVQPVPLVEQGADRRVRLADLPVVDRVLEVALLEVDQQVLAVLRDRGIRVAARVLRLAEDEPVFGLVRAQGVEVHRHRLRTVAPGRVVFPRGIAAVEEARVVRHPRDRRELGEVDQVARVLATLDVVDLPLPPVRAAVRLRVGDVAAVPTGRHPGERHRSVVAPAVGIEQDAPGRLVALLVHRLGDVDHALVLQPVVVAVEVALAPLAGRAPALVVPDRQQPLLDRFAARERGQEWLGDGVLRRHPGRGLLAVEVLQPAVRVGDLDPEVVVDLVDRPGIRILDRARVEGVGGTGQEGKNKSRREPAKSGFHDGAGL